MTAEPEPGKKDDQNHDTYHHNHANFDPFPLITGIGGREIEGKQAFGGTLVSGPELVGEGGGVNGAVGCAVGEVTDGGTGEVGGKEAGEAGGTRGTRGAVLEGLVAIGNNVVEGRLRNGGLELGAGVDAHAALGDPASLEAAGSADVDAGDEFVD